MKQYFFFNSKAFYQECKSIGNPHRCAILRPTVKLHSNHWITLLFDTIFFEGPKWRFKFGFYYLLFFLYNGCFALQPSQYHNFQQLAIKVYFTRGILHYCPKIFTPGLKQIWGCNQLFVLLLIGNLNFTKLFLFLKKIFFFNLEKKIWI